MLGNPSMETRAGTSAFWQKRFQNRRESALCKPGKKCFEKKKKRKKEGRCEWGEVRSRRGQAERGEQGPRYKRPSVPRSGLCTSSRRWGAAQKAVCRRKGRAGCMGSTQDSGRSAESRPDAVTEAGDPVKMQPYRWSAGGGSVRGVRALQMRALRCIHQGGLCLREQSGRAERSPTARFRTHESSNTRKLKRSLWAPEQARPLGRRYIPSSSSPCRVHKNPGHKIPGEWVRPPQGNDRWEEKTVHSGILGRHVQVQNVRSYQPVKNLGSCWQHSFSFWRRTKKGLKQLASLWGLWDPCHCQKDVSLKIKSFLSAIISFSMLLKG